MVPGRDGTTRAWRVHKFAYADGAGNRYVAGIAVDITDRRQVEAKLTELANIVESSDDAIISKDLNGIVRSWNRGAEAMFGYRAAQMIGEPITKLFPEGRRHEEHELLARIARGERIVHHESIRLRHDGIPVHVSITLSPLQTSDGRIVGASSILRDISERLQAEEALRRANDELEQRVAERTRELHEKNLRLQEKNAELEEFHDVVIGRELKMMEMRDKLAKYESSRKPEKGANGRD
jgi:PAS domain S-box-containing protein